MKLDGLPSVGGELLVNLGLVGFQLWVKLVGEL